MTAGSPGAATDSVWPTLETKLSPPPARAGIVSRPRVVRLIEELGSRKLTLVSAPAGSGKTLALAEWARSRNAAVVWVSLDEADNDSRRLWTYVATGMERIRGGLGRNALKRLAAVGVPLEACVDEALLGLAAYREPVAIVLDDLHLVSSDVCLGSIGYLLEHLPPNARVIVGTRADPMLRLSRLAAARELGEVRAKDLGLSDTEASAMLAASGVELDEEGVHVLAERCDGWAAGLSLAALWLSHHPSPREGVAGFAGVDGHVADYLTGEVLEGLDAATRRFLLRTAPLRRMNAELCDEVTGGTGSRAVLDELSRTNMFLVPLDAKRRWFRYHHLFADVVRLELDRLEPRAAEAVLGTAARWCEREGLHEEAIDYALETGDLEFALDVLRRVFPSMMRAGRTATVLELCGRFPEATLEHEPEIAVAYIAAATLDRQSRTRRRRLAAVAERAVASLPDGARKQSATGMLSTALALHLDDDVTAARERARAAVEHPDERGDSTSFATSLLAFNSYLDGDLEQARRRAVETLARPDVEARPHALVRAYAVVALVDCDAGRLRTARDAAERGLAALEAAGLERSLSAGAAHQAMAAVLEAEGALGQAENEAERAVACARGPERTIGYLHALVTRGRIRAKRRDLKRAGDDLVRARTAATSFADCGMLLTWIAEAEAIIEADRPLDGPVEPPTAAELMVLRELASERSLREIGAALFLSRNTVKTHTNRVYRKLGVTSRRDAVARATVLGLLEPDHAD